MAQREKACSVADFGLFLQAAVVRSGDAVHGLAAPLRCTPFPPGEWVGALVSPSPTKDVFSIGDRNRNTNLGFVVASLHGTRSHDRGTRVE
jgi:hypothetical protein